MKPLQHFESRPWADHMSELFYYCTLLFIAAAAYLFPGQSAVINCAFEALKTTWAVNLSSSCASLLEQACCCCSVFLYHSYLHMRNTTHLWFFYVNPLHSAAVPQSWHWLSLHILFAVVFCDRYCEMPQRRKKKKKKGSKRFFSRSTELLTFECLSVALQFCSFVLCSVPFKLWNRVIEVA